MGMFDTVRFKCPNCKKREIEVQSKAGDCLLADYCQEKVPQDIAKDIEGEESYCQICHTTWRVIDCTPSPTTVMGLVQV